MSRPVLLVVVAHPDDESFGCGSLVADAVARGFDVVVCCATRGEAGHDATGSTAGPDELAARREAELRDAARLLGAGHVDVLGYADSGWDGPAPDNALVAVDVDEVADAVAAVLARHRPTVVVTLDPTGSDGHRDHAAIGAATTLAFGRAVTRDASLYHWCLPRSLMRRWASEVAGRDGTEVYLEVELGRPDEEVTTVLDVSAVQPARRRAMAAHGTQTSPFTGCTAELEAAFLDADHLVRVVPAWTGGPVEATLLAPGPAADTASR